VQLKDIVVEHGYGECNETGMEIIDFCASNGLTVDNSMFPHHPRRSTRGCPLMAALVTR